LAHGTKFPLSARIVAAQRFLERIFDSSWAFVASLFSKKTPTENNLPQHKSSIGEHLTIEEEPRKKGRWWKIPLEILATLSAILGVLGFVVSTRTKLSVDPSDSLVSYSPMGTTFVLSNEGSLDIHSVAVSAANLHLENSDPKTGFQVIGAWEFTNVPKDATADILSAGHKMGLPYPRNFGLTAISNFTGGSFTFIVRYRPDWLPWRKKEIFPFEAIRTTDGKWVWKPVAQ
jgi:hypothetical protein